MKPNDTDGSIPVGDEQAPVAREWNGSPCPRDPDNCWIDDETGEHVSAVTFARTAKHPQ